MSDAQTGKNRRHTLLGTLRQAVYERLAGYEDVNPSTPGPSVCVSIPPCAAAFTLPALFCLLEEEGFTYALRKNMRVDEERWLQPRGSPEESPFREPPG